MDDKFNDLLNYIDDVSNQNRVTIKKTKFLKRLFRTLVSVISICFLVTAGYFLKIAIDNKKDFNESYKIKNDIFTSVVDENIVKFNELKALNDDTVAWLKVNNTVIDYPVVQAIDNVYYLNHDFNGSKNVYGWIFADYRNTFPELSQNTIIYGHNTTAGIMFGDLLNAIESDWYLNPENQIISLDTTNGVYKFQIFSIYKTNYTSDYLDVSFIDDFDQYVEKVKKRSIYDFDVEIADEKLLTLSTCYDHTNNGTKFVIHAKLIS